MVITRRFDLLSYKMEVNQVATLHQQVKMLIQHDKQHKQHDIELEVLQTNNKLTCKSFSKDWPTSRMRSHLFNLIMTLRIIIQDIACQLGEIQVGVGTAPLNTELKEIGAGWPNIEGTWGCSCQFDYNRRWSRRHKRKSPNVGRRKITDALSNPNRSLTCTCNQDA